MRKSTESNKKRVSFAKLPKGSLGRSFSSSESSDEFPPKILNRNRKQTKKSKKISPKEPQFTILKREPQAIETKNKKSQPSSSKYGTKERGAINKYTPMTSPPNVPTSNYEQRESKNEPQSEKSKLVAKHRETKDESQPSTSKYGSQPSTSKYGSQPSTSKYGSQPSTSKYGSQPSTSKYEPTKSDENSNLKQESKTDSQVYATGSQETNPSIGYLQSKITKMRVKLLDSEDQRRIDELNRSQFRNRNRKRKPSTALIQPTFAKKPPTDSQSEDYDLKHLEVEWKLSTYDKPSDEIEELISATSDLTISKEDLTIFSVHKDPLDPTKFLCDYGIQSTEHLL